MSPHARASAPLPTARDDARAYLFEMVEEMAKMARRVGEDAVAIHLQAILEAGRSAQRKRPA